MKGLKVVLKLILKETIGSFWYPVRNMLEKMDQLILWI